MGSKGRIPPPPHIRNHHHHHHHHHNPLQGNPAAGILQNPSDLFGPGLRPPHPLPNPQFPPYDIDHKLSSQHLEIQRLATENRRLAATHGTLRQELAAAQHELQMLSAHIAAAKAERARQVDGIRDRIAQMEMELKNAEPVRSDLHQARQDAENLVVSRDDLLAKLHRLRQELHRAHSDVQQIPLLVSELDALRLEFQRCRMSYEHEKKLYSDHYESLQGMEKNYTMMTKEVEKLRAQLSSYSAAPGSNVNETASGRHSGQNVAVDGYGVHQGQVHVNYPAYSGAAAAANAGAAAHGVAGAVAHAYIGAQSGTPASIPGYPAHGGTSYDGSGYDPQYTAARPVYDVHGVGYAYNMQQGAGYDAATFAGYAHAANFDTSGVASKAATGHHVQAASANNAAYGPASANNAAYRPASANNTAYGSAAGAVPPVPMTQGANPTRR